MLCFRNIMKVLGQFKPGSNENAAKSFPAYFTKDKKKVTAKEIV